MLFFIQCRSSYCSISSRWWFKRTQGNPRKHLPGFLHLWIFHSSQEGDLSRACKRCLDLITSHLYKCEYPLTAVSFFHYLNFCKENHRIMFKVISFFFCICIIYFFSYALLVGASFVILKMHIYVYKIFANLSIANYSFSCAVGLHSAILVGKGSALLLLPLGRA